MIGFSINLFDDIEYIERYIRTMQAAGFENVFTTIYEPDEEKDEFKTTLKQVANICRELDLNLRLGLSKGSAQEMDLKIRPETFLNYGIKAVRATPDISNKIIAELTKHIKVAVSASHTDKNDLEEIRDYGGNTSMLEAWYYYYERDEIGLSAKYMKKKNKFWAKHGIKTAAFAPGDDDLSGDFNPRLTLEAHRGRHPLYATIDLLENHEIDSVYIGDSWLNEKTIHQFERYMHDDIIVFYVDVLDYEYFSLLEGVHRNRIDEADLVIRAENSLDIEDRRIVDRFLISRPKGSLTIDNHRNGRFMGEFHITKEDMPLSNRTNVVAHVRDEDIDLIDRCYGGYEFEIVENSGD